MNPIMDTAQPMNEDNPATPLQASSPYNPDSQTMLASPNE